MNPEQTSTVKAVFRQKLGGEWARLAAHSTARQFSAGCGGGGQGLPAPGRRPGGRRLARFSTSTGAPPR
jgi:hypothetical protein